MVTTISFQLGDLEIKLDNNNLGISHSQARIFHSLNSSYLESYKEGVISSKDFGGNKSLEGLNPEYITNYRRFLGFRYIHLGALDISGFANPNYDLSFCFSIKTILDTPHLICDHDKLFNLLLYGTDTSIQNLFENSYSQGSEILIKELDLKKSLFALVYSDEAKSRLQRTLPSLKQYDLAQMKKALIL